MKKEQGILIASAVSLVTVLGFIGLRRFLSQKKDNHHNYYDDFHRLLINKKNPDENHGIEYLAVR